MRCNSFDNLPEKGSPSPRPSLPKTFIRSRCMPREHKGHCATVRKRKRQTYGKEKCDRQYSIRFFPRCGRTFRPSYVLLSVRKMSGQDGLARLLCSGMYQKHLLPSGGILAGKDLFSILRAGIPVQGYPLWKMSAPLPQDRRDRGVSSRSLP